MNKKRLFLNFDDMFNSKIICEKLLNKFRSKNQKYHRKHHDNYVLRTTVSSYKEYRSLIGEIEKYLLQVKDH